MSFNSILQYKYFKSAVQFYRRVSDNGRDLGKKTTDSFMLMLWGLDRVDFLTTLEDCVYNMYVGARAVNTEIPGGVEVNLSECAAEDKDFGY